MLIVEYYRSFFQLWHSTKFYFASLLIRNKQGIFTTPFRFFLAPQYIAAENSQNAPCFTNL